ncbi:MAG: HAD-IA family hydrolase [Clostridia bacterium]|nr:HAD-IA family hydrolase [Clostridia bacterium]
MKKSAVIWDLDGTIIDSFYAIVGGIYNAAKENNIEYTKEYIYDYAKEYSSISMLEKIAAEAGVTLESVKKTFDYHFHGEDDKIELIGGAKEILEFVRDNSMINLSYTHRNDTSYDILKRNGIEDYFTEIITSERGFKRKPNSDAVKYLIDKYDLDINNTFFVGDRKSDAACGNGAGIRSILLGEYEGCYSDYTIKELIEVKKIIVRKF